MSHSVSHTATLLHKASLSLTHSYMEAGFVSSPKCLSNHSLLPMCGYGVLEVKAPGSPGQVLNCRRVELGHSWGGELGI